MSFEEKWAGDDWVLKFNLTDDENTPIEIDWEIGMLIRNPLTKAEVEISPSNTVIADQNNIETRGHFNIVVPSLETVKFKRPLPADYNPSKSYNTEFAACRLYYITDGSKETQIAFNIAVRSF